MISRRTLLSGFAADCAFAAETADTIAPEWSRYPDPATEFEILRLTDPRHTSLYCPPYNRAISRGTAFLIYSSDRAGATQLYRMDLKTGRSEQLTHSDSVAPKAFGLIAGDKSVCLLDGGMVRILSLRNRKLKTPYDPPRGWELGSELSVGPDGRHAAVVEHKRGNWRLRVIDIRHPHATTLVEADQPLSAPLVGPGKRAVVYRRAETVRIVSADRSEDRPLHVTADGRTGPALWSARGDALFYLNFPSDRKQLNGLWEYQFDGASNRKIASTSQFVQFDRNGDASVFVGASGSIASPYVLLLIRTVRREFTLCEHHASNPAAVMPVFSPNSQRVFFQSDRHGKMAIYSVRVDKIVSETNES